MLRAVAASVCPRWASRGLGLLLPAHRLRRVAQRGAPHWVSASLPRSAASPVPRAGWHVSGRCWCGAEAGRLAGGSWHMAWAPLPSAVGGGQRPGRMTRQVPTAPLIVWSLARLELDVVVLVRVHWALACGAACLPLSSWGSSAWPQPCFPGSRCVHGHLVAGLQVALDFQPDPSGPPGLLPRALP